MDIDGSSGEDWKEIFGEKEKETRGRMRYWRVKGEQQREVEREKPNCKINVDVTVGEYLELVRARDLGLMTASLGIGDKSQLALEDDPVEVLEPQGTIY